ncbi:MAG TPA: TerD family protein [Chthonomonadaceae bacterium]|nr:TerD family protein [Chthonomonadaceae bacterium]
MNNSIYLRRRHKILVPSGGRADPLPLEFVLGAAKNFEALGFAPSHPLVDALRALTREQFVDLYKRLIHDLRAVKGAHREFKPMYPNFPSEVMEMSDAQLYFNAIVHYWTAGRFLPVSDTRNRDGLTEATPLTWIELGAQEEFESLFAQIASANASLSDQDKDDLEWFVQEYRDGIGVLMPAAIRQKETLAYVGALLLKHTERAADLIQDYCRTATDVLRLAAAMSGGDVSLATNTKYRTFSRPERRLLLTLIERQSSAIEDMLRFPERWKRLGEKLHPGEFKVRYPKAFDAFSTIRNDLPFTTFNSAVEQALAANQVADAAHRLAARPGDFARRLDHLLRSDEESQAVVLAEFAAAVPRVSTPVLLQASRHFRARNAPAELRVFFAKGNLAKAQAIPYTLQPLSESVCLRVSALCEEALLARFSALPPLGHTYVDEELKNYVVPFAMRSSSRSFRTLVRGTGLPLPEGKALRFFVWWKNGEDRTDIDLAAALLNARFEMVDLIAYYNLKAHGGCHSGDIVDAPDGASEFIDLDPAILRQNDVRYVAMTVMSFTRQSYCDLPECFAGWMARQDVESGEIYEPKTVQDKLDITADTRTAIPLIVDIVENRVVWCDVALRKKPTWQNNVHGNLTGINLTARAMMDLKKPCLYDLFSLHGRARGLVVATPERADTIFSVAAGTPFRLEEIASQYMA